MTASSEAREIVLERERALPDLDASVNSILGKAEKSCFGSSKVALSELGPKRACKTQQEQLGTLPQSYLSNEEAAAILKTKTSELEADLSRHGYRFAKRAFDIILSSLTLVILLVPALMLSAVIYIKSPGASPFYSQWRVGRLKKDGSYKIFKMWKFRSMVPHADKMLKDLQAANEADGPLFKIKDDPRVIPGVGTFIRKHSIDEFGQVFNVFLGDICTVVARLLHIRRLCKGGAALL